MAYRGNGYLDPWEWWRKAGLVVALLGALALYMFFALPFGICALLLVYVVSGMWKPIGITDPTLGTYMVDTKPYKVAVFFMAYHARFRQLIAPMTSLGFGPPTEDPDHGLEPGWWPIGRLSAFWAFLAAVPLGWIDIVTGWARMPFWGNVMLPGWVMGTISTIAWFALIQTVMATFRIQGSRSSIIAPEPAPATMITRLHDHMDVAKLIRRSVAIGIAPVVVIAALWMANHWPAIPSLIAIGISLSFTALVSMSRMMMVEYRAGWNERNGRRDFWTGVFSTVRKVDVPTLVGEVDLPPYEEWAQQEHEPDEPYAAKVKVAAFMFPQGATFYDYVGIEEQINGPLAAVASTVSPLMEVDPSTGMEIPGTVGYLGFRVWWTTERVVVQDLWKPGLDPYVREFGVRALILPMISSLRGIGHCNLVSCNMMTRPGSTANILEIRVAPAQPNVSLNSFISQLSSMSTNIGVPWVRAYQDTSGSDSFVTLMLGDDPSAEGVKFVNPSRIVRRVIDIANWSYYFYTNGIVGDGGTPRLITRRPTTPVVDELVFNLPAGLNFSSIRSRIPALKTTSGNAFMETALGAAESTGKASTVAAQQEKAKDQSSKFTMIAARNDPLMRLFPFGDYRSQILYPRCPGKERIIWHPGVLANDQLATDDFDAEEPHLLIAASSGAGKAQDVDEVTLTTKGFKRHGDLQEGDVVYDINGNRTRVIKAFDPYRPEEAYDVRFDDGTSIRVSGDHLWTVQTSEGRARAKHAATLAESAAIRNGDLGVTIRALRDVADTLDSHGSLTPVHGYDAGTLLRRHSDGRFAPADEWIRDLEDLDGAWMTLSPSDLDLIRSVHPMAWGVLLSGWTVTYPGNRFYSSTDNAAELLRSMGYQITDYGRVGQYEFHCLTDVPHRVFDVVSGMTNRAALQIVLEAFAGREHEVAAGFLSATYVSGVGHLVHRKVADVVTPWLTSLGYGVEESRAARTLLTLSVTVPVGTVTRMSQVDGYRVRQTAWASGLIHASGSDYATFRASDPTILVDAARHGYRLEVAEQHGRGKTKVRISGGQIVRGADLVASLSDPEVAEEFLMGYVRLAGSVTESGNVVASRTYEVEIAAKSVKIGSLVDGFYVAPADWRTQDTPEIGIVRQAREALKFDVNGKVVMTIDQIAEVTGFSRTPVDDVIGEMGIEPSASWSQPVEQEYISSDTIKPGRRVAYYPAATVVREMANAIAARLRDPDSYGSTDADFEVWATRDMVRSLISENGAAYFSVPIFEDCLEGASDDGLPVRPYSLGAWLGDGISRTGSICGEDIEVFHAVKSEYPDATIDEVGRSKDGLRPFYHFRSRAMIQDLKTAGLVGPGLKRIPWEYQVASKDVRMALAQGLMDTDGSYGSFVALSNRDLVLDVKLLLLGLGLKVHETVRTFEDSVVFKNAKPSTRLYWTSDKNVDLHRMTRKREWAIDEASPRVKRRYITSIDPIPAEDIPMMRCIAVDSPTHTYLAGPNLVATHNSVVLQNMLLQLIHNNGPEDLRLWLVEPKIGLGRFRGVDNVERYVDSWNPDDQFFENTANMFEDAVQEMLRRNGVLSRHRKQPEKLEQARSIARSEGPLADGSPNPMMMPFIVIVVEECATVFADALSKEDREAQARILYNATRIAREGRSAGIYMVALTQYPTNASIPSIIRQQMRRIGLSTRNAFTSRIVIEEDGLEELRIKGTGLIKMDRDFRTFRGFLPNSGDPDQGEPNDIFDIINSVPKNVIVPSSGSWSESERLIVPDPDQTVFRAWSHVTGTLLDKAIDAGRPTKDKVPAGIVV